MDGVVTRRVVECFSAWSVSHEVRRLWFQPTLNEHSINQQRKRNRPTHSVYPNWVLFSWKSWSTLTLKRCPLHTVVTLTNIWISQPQKVRCQIPPSVSTLQIKQSHACCPTFQMGHCLKLISHILYDVFSLLGFHHVCNFRSHRSTENRDPSGLPFTTCSTRKKVPFIVFKILFSVYHLSELNKNVVSLYKMLAVM